MTTRDDLLASVEAARQEIIELCQALVRIPTVSTGIMPTGDELPAAELLRDKLAADGIAGDIFLSAPNRGNYIATMRGSGQFVLAIAAGLATYLLGRQLGLEAS